MESIHYIVYFFIYAFLGWICECIFCSIGNKKIINRGFLNGPVCPIYGFGSIILIYFLMRFENNIILLFVFGVILTSILEYITGWILEHLFNTKWWDYSNHKLNIKGRVCLRNSILFGFMGIFLIKYIHKNIVMIIDFIPNIILIGIVIAICIYFISDIAVTLNTMRNLNNKLNKLDDIFKELNKFSIDIETLNYENCKGIDIDDKESLNEIFNKINNIKNKSKLQKRIIDAFPNMKHKKHYKQLIYFKKILTNKKKSHK